jgi:hypothetical protein
VTGNEARKIVGAGERDRRSSNRHPTEPQAIRAELRGSTETMALGITARGAAPVLDLCRRLVTAGSDPNRPLHCYRGDVLALKVRTIGEGARLAISSKGVGFVPRQAVRTASPMREKAGGGTGAGTCSRTAPAAGKAR